MINFFQAYLAAPITALSFAGYKVWFMTKFVRVSEMDIRTGIRDETEELQAFEYMDEAEEEGKGLVDEALRLLCCISRDDRRATCCYVGIIIRQGLETCYINDWRCNGRFTSSCDGMLLTLFLSKKFSRGKTSDDVEYTGSRGLPIKSFETLARETA